MSRPPTPGHYDPRDLKDFRFKTNGTPCESGESYHPGDYHPIHFGDILNNRYEIIRKIGYGSYSTVWLPFDRQSEWYAAVKISLASMNDEDVNRELSMYSLLESSESHSLAYVATLWDHFIAEGPNGRHPCYVFEPLGPDLNSMLRIRPEFVLGDPWERRFPKAFVKQVLRDVLKGLQLLHSQSIVHGDVHQGNFLMNVDPTKLATLSREDLEQPLSQRSPLQRKDGRQDSWAPEYLIGPASLHEYLSNESDPLVKLSDLGGASMEDQPPSSTVTPVSLRAPELIMGLKPTTAIDIWCIGCLIFELLTGVYFFRAEPLEGDKFDEEYNDEHLIHISEIVGSLPKSIFKLWARGDQYFDADASRLHIPDDDGDSKTDSVFGDSGEGNKHESTCESGGIDNEEMSKTVPLACPQPCKPLEELFHDKKPVDIDSEEKKELVQLMRWVLQHDASLRPSASEILQHPWFT